MDALEQARAEIDTVDAQLAALFERRMAAVLQVAEYKRAHGLPIYDAAREAAVLEKAAARIQQPALRPYYKDHVQHMMDLAKQYGVQMPSDQLFIKGEAFAIRAGGRSPRVARQFIELLSAGVRL